MQALDHLTRPVTVSINIVDQEDTTHSRRGAIKAHLLGSEGLFVEPQTRVLRFNDLLDLLCVPVQKLYAIGA
jgi:hypothetical protein